MFVILEKFFKLLITCAVVLALSYETWSFMNSNNELLDAMMCDNDSINSIDQRNVAGYLEDVVLSSRQPQFEKSIFFIESSNAINSFRPKSQSDLVVKLNARQACAIESAALMNPNTDIFVLFIGRSFRINITDQPILGAILSYRNIHFRKLDLYTFVSGTPPCEWFKTGKLFKTDYPGEDTADLVRLLVLWKWGGTYFDLDVIVLKSFENLPSNYAGAERADSVANGVMNFAANGFGHEIVNLCLRDFQENFDGTEWANNGPIIITRVLRKICGTRFTAKMSPERCHQFTVYPPRIFYAIEAPSSPYFFLPMLSEIVMEKINGSFLAHIWSSLTKSFKMKVGSSAAYGKLAEVYCSKVYGSCGDSF